MSLTAQSPQPTLAWQFESSNVDSVTGLAPSSQVSPGPAQLQGSAALVTNAPTSNTAVSFNGTTGSYMNLGTSPVNVNLTTSNIFVEYWVYLNDQSLSYPVVITVGPTGGQWRWALSFLTTTLTPRLGMNSNGNNLNSSIAIAGVQTWSHVAFSFNRTSAGAGTAYLFVNGQPGGSMAVTGLTYSAADTAYIAAYPTGGLMNGYIRDLRVVQGGVVPVTTFTPEAAPFSYALPSYVTGSGTTVFTLLGQFITYPPGKYKQAISILNYPVGTPNTGTNYITWTNYGTFNPSVGVTVCFWINVNALPASGQQSIPLWMRGSAVNSAVFINLTPTNWGAFYTDGTNYYGPTSSTPLSTGVWYHLTVVVGAGTVVGYQNGVQIASPVAFSNPLDVSGFLYIGGSGNYGPTSALFDDLRIFNTVLTSAQVQAIYNAQGMPRQMAMTNTIGTSKTTLTRIN